MKAVYRAATLEQAEEALAEFERTWNSRYPMIGKSWRANWPRIIPFFSYPEDIRKAIYTTNAIESLNNSLRKVTKNRNSFPNDEAAIKLLYMALKNIAKKWTMPIQNWSLALHQFSIRFEGRVVYNIITIYHPPPEGDEGEKPTTIDYPFTQKF